MRLWILFGCGVLILGAAVWPYSRRTEQLAPAPVPPAVAVKPTSPEPPKPEPAKIVEVIDLARAYEPVPEPEDPVDAVNPAAFIELPEQPKPIPPAGELIDVMPREVIALGNGLLEYVPIPRLVFTPMGVPYTNDAGQQVPPNEAIQNGLLNFTPTRPAPVERLDLMAREVAEVVIPSDRFKGGESKLVTLERILPMPRPLPARFVVDNQDGQLVNYVEAPGDAVVPVPGFSSPAKERLTQPIPRRALSATLIPLEYLTVQPHVPGICREEQERHTSVREDDFDGLIDPGSVGPVEQLKVLPREVPENPYRGPLDEIKRASVNPVWLYDTPDWNSDGITASWPAWDVEIDPIWSLQQRPSNFIRAFYGSSGIFFVNERLSDQLIAVRSLVLTCGPTDVGR